MSGPSPHPGSVAQVDIAHGQVTGHHGTRFGGLTCVPASAGRPAQVRIAVRHDAGELTANLCEGDTLDLHGKTWRLDAIRSDGRRWHATLTCIE